VRMAENGGAYVARNQGLDMATGEFVTLNDADDWSHPKKIETQVRFMMENPKVMGCTSEQYRCLNDFCVTKIRGTGGFITFNTSSFLWRLDPVKDALGYWDTVRFGADNEFVRRMQAVFGRESFQRIPTGPLSFQRDSSSSVTSNPIKGIDSGEYYGVRREYFLAQSYFHRTASTLKYYNDKSRRPFEVPPMMINLGSDSYNRVFDVVICGDFSVANKDITNIVETIEGLAKSGKSVGLVERLSIDNDTTEPSEEIRQRISVGKASMCVYGENISYRKLIELEPQLSASGFAPSITNKI
jgi:glycosyltransferase involved in cell wall biosynthesis